MTVDEGWIARSLYGCVCPDCGPHTMKPFQFWSLGNSGPVDYDIYG